MIKGNYVKLVKLEDTMFNGQHPNGVYANMEITGRLVTDLVVGVQLMLDDVRGDFNSWFHTSVVREIVDENTFKTNNSVYHIELIPAFNC